MQLLGTKNKVEKPIIRANGISLAAVTISNQVGDIPYCSFQIPPEFSIHFAPGKMIEIRVESSSANGVVFVGPVAGTSYSNSTGNINCRIDLIHKAAHALDNASTLFPGNMPGSATDNEAYIKVRSNKAGQGTKAGGTIVDLILSDNFGEDLKKFCNFYIDSAAKSSSHGMTEPNGANEIKQAIGDIQSFTGQIKNSGAVQSTLSVAINNALKSATLSSTFWNVLSSFLSQIELVFVCKTNGELMLLPNLSGVKSDGEIIPSEWVMKFDQSSQYERTPKEVYVLIGNIPAKAGEDALKHTQNMDGHYVLEGGPANASGQLCVPAPEILRSVTQEGGANKEVLDAYAETICIRETAKFNMCNVLCPLILDVFPGVPVSFKYSSEIKSFSGEKIAGFEKEFDGYCWKIVHEITTQGSPTTVFSLSHVSDGSFTKTASHPLWSGYAVPKW